MPAVAQLIAASTPASTVVSMVEPSSWNCAGMAGTGTVELAAPGLTVAGTTVGVAADLTMVVAGLGALAGLATALATTAFATTAAPAAATPAATGFATGRFPTARTAAGGRLGLTVMRAVSLGGALLTMVVPDLLFGSVIEPGVEAAGFSGTPPGGGGVTSVVAGATGAGGVTGVIGAGGVPGTSGLTALNGAGAIAATGLIGETGAGGAPGAAGLTALNGAGVIAATGLMGETGAGGAPGTTGLRAPMGAGAPGTTGRDPGGTGVAGIAGLAGRVAPGAGMTGGGGPALAVPVVGKLAGGVSMGCVRRGGAKTDSIEAAGAFMTPELAAGRMAVVVGETRGGAVTELDFFLAASASASAATAPAVTTATAGATDVGR
jgi:collagen type I/II/III/V/XI/XXIV/XXVII alpha